MAYRMPVFVPFPADFRHLRTALRWAAVAPPEGPTAPVLPSLPPPAPGPNVPPAYHVDEVACRLEMFSNSLIIRARVRPYTDMPELGGGDVDPLELPYHQRLRRIRSDEPTEAEMRDAVLSYTTMSNDLINDEDLVARHRISLGGGSQVVHSHNRRKGGHVNWFVLGGADFIRGVRVVSSRAEGYDIGTELPIDRPPDRESFPPTPHDPRSFLQTPTLPPFSLALHPLKNTDVLDFHVRMFRARQRFTVYNCLARGYKVDMYSPEGSPEHERERLELVQWPPSYVTAVKLFTRAFGKDFLDRFDVSACDEYMNEVRRYRKEHYPNPKGGRRKIGKLYGTGD